MDDSKDPRLYYFSTYHLARDFIGTAGPFTVFVILAIVLFKPVYELADNVAHEVAPDTSWIIVISAVVAYLLVAFVVGTIANRTVLAIRDFLERTENWKNKVEYTAFYKTSRTAIEELYDKYIVKTSPLWVDRDLDLFERVDRLCHLFKLYNPSGFQHLYRDYSFVFMYRQAFMYSLVFLGIFVSQGKWLASIFFVGVTLVVFLAIKAGVREAVHSEYQFIFATASWLELQNRDRREEAGGKQKTCNPRHQPDDTAGTAPRD